MPIIMRSIIGTLNNHHFPYGTNGKVVLGVPILKPFRVFPGKRQGVFIRAGPFYSHQIPRDNQHDREQQKLLKSITAIGSKYLSGNNLPQISVILCKLSPDKYLHPFPAC